MEMLTSAVEEVLPSDSSPDVMPITVETVFAPAESVLTKPRSALIDHMRRRHRKEMQAEKVKAAIGVPEDKEITETIAMMMALDLQPLSMVENYGFRTLLSKLIPHYIIPSRKHYAMTIIPCTTLIKLGNAGDWYWKRNTCQVPILEKH